MSPEPFTTTGVTDIEKNADLVMYVLELLEHKRSVDEPIWPGERHMRTLLYTCHVVEAFYRLRLGGITEPLLEAALDWLLELPFGQDLPTEELRPLRIYPSRFKTLALLGRFEPSRLLPDFEDLSSLLDSDTGWIYNAPFDLTPALGTMIWADIALTLGPAHLPPSMSALLPTTLATLDTAFTAWMAKAGAALPPTPTAPPKLGGRLGEITNPGDASYALDLLLRAHKLTPTSERAQHACTLFTAAIRARRSGDLRRSDLLYASLHLRAHFPDNGDIQRVVENFIAELRERYQTNEAQREPVSFHALVLRLLVAQHGLPLRDQLVSKLWQITRATVKAQQAQAQQALEAEFTKLVRQSIRVHLSPPQRITGTRARGEVYRVRFGLTTEATDDHGAPLSTPSNTLRLIVKKGPPAMLERAIERYRALPDPLQRLFARHTHMAETRTTPGYLVMQDLADMFPLSEIMAQVEKLAGREKAAQARQAARTIATVLSSLHRYEHTPIIISHNQFNQMYLAPMVLGLNRLCRPSAFPELKQWLVGPLTVNGHSYKRPEWYFKQLARFEQRLRPPTLGYIHGDCHTRNIMLTRDAARAMFVDIDTLATAEDYMLDYGLLIEDLVVYQSLPYGDEPGRITWDTIQTQRPDTQQTTTLENWIEYPAFPQRAETVKLFQRELLQQLRAYAESIGDVYWQERLWLAIARGLVLLAGRQLTSHTVEPRRRPTQAKVINDLKLVQVTYAEAIRLLHELIEHLDSKETAPLPDLPFPGEHRLVTRSLPHTDLTNLVDAISTEFGGVASRSSAPDTPYYIDYETIPNHQVFARIHAQRHAPALYLPFAPDQLDDPQHLLQACPEMAWPTRLLLTRHITLPAVLALVKQAYHRAVGGPVQ